MKRWALILVGLALLGGVCLAQAWTTLLVEEDPLVRMPGTQPGRVVLEGPNRCLNCHEGYDPDVEPGTGWKGSMMAQAARDFLFFACMTVAGQDSVWAVGRPNAVDICERCHFPMGWLDGRSDPPNASAMTGADYDGVQCDFCHRMVDPFFATTYDGSREGADWLNYWDETNLSDTPSQPAADSTLVEDGDQTSSLLLFNGSPFFQAGVPFTTTYTENGGGQYSVSADDDKRAPFADADGRHPMLYSRYHKSKYFCSACHDVSNPVLANLAYDGTSPGDGSTVLPTELASAYSYFHVERTFSEFMLSAYAQQGGAPGDGPFSPAVFETSQADNYIATCQDCHMRDAYGAGADMNGAIIRPDGSVEHPNSGLPTHDLTGGNIWVSSVLASAISGSPNYNALNDQLLNQGAALLTLDLGEGQGVDPVALLAGADRAKGQLEDAASIQNLTYNRASGELTLEIHNHTGHKLISGFPEGRRMFLNIKAYADGTLIYEVNPYDYAAGTLKGLSYPYTVTHPLPAALGSAEVYTKALVYEMHPSSSLTGEHETFHFALADGRYKDNRIPPRGFQIGDAALRLSEPVWDGQSAPALYTAAEYAGGYDAVIATIAGGADTIEVTLFYQTTSREYIEFLRDEINGTGHLTLASPTPSGEAEAYIVQNDPFFGQMVAWGDTIWQLWLNNTGVAGAEPVTMTHLVYQPPTAVDLVYLRADRVEEGVRLSWQTAYELDLLGFNVLRSDLGGDIKITVNSELIPAQMTGEILGVVYTYTDLTALPDQAFSYWLQAVETSGADSLHGPVSVPGRAAIYLPVVESATP